MLTLRGFHEGPRPNILTVLRGCADDPESCLAYSGDLSSAQTFPVRLQGGQVYRIVVDGLRGGSQGEDGDVGDYELSIYGPCLETCSSADCNPGGCGLACNDCMETSSRSSQDACAAPPGTDCAVPIPLELVDDGPWDAAPNEETWGAEAELSRYAGNAVEPASGGGGSFCGDAPHAGVPGVVFSFTPTTTGVHTVTLTHVPDPGTWGLFIAEACGGVSQPCVATGSGALPTQVTLVAGTTYYFLVEGSQDPLGVGDAWFDPGPLAIHVEGPCVGTCAVNQCGLNGCDELCGLCGAGEGCDPGGFCTVPSWVPGDTCADVVRLHAPMEVRGDTALAADDSHVGNLACGSLPALWGKGQPDVIYELTPPEDALYRFHLSMPTGGGLYVTTSCGDDEGTCVGAAKTGADSKASLTVPLSGGTTYFLVVDGSGSTGSGDGPYVLRVAAPCVPDCDGKVCGDDGCGGTCGACEGVSVCDDRGTCLSTKSVAGDSGQDPAILPEGGAVQLPAFPATDGVPSFEGVCPSPPSSVGPGAFRPDRVIRFSPSRRGTYQFAVDLDLRRCVESLDAPPRLTLIDGCAASAAQGSSPTCVWQRTLESPHTVFEMCLDVGRDYCFVVDRYDAALKAVALRNFSSLPSVGCEGRVCGAAECGGEVCGDCPDGLLCDELAGYCRSPPQVEGNGCLAPRVVDTVPFDTIDDTRRFDDEVRAPWPACGMQNLSGSTVVVGVGAPDAVYRLTAPASGVYEASLTSQADADGHYASLILYAVTDCERTQSSCLGFEVAEPRAVLPVSLAAGQTAYFVVDGSLWYMAGPYTFSITTSDELP